MKETGREVLASLKKVLRRLRTEPFLWLFAAGVLGCLLFCGISVEKTAVHKEYFTLKGVVGEAYREAWNGPKDFILSVRDETGKKYKILAKGDYVYSGEREAILKAGVVGAESLKTQAPATAGNYHEFDYCRYLKSHGVDLVAYVGAGELWIGEDLREGLFSAEFRDREGAEKRVQRSLAFYSSRIREDISESLDRYFDGGFSALIKAVMTGETGALDTEAKGNLTSAGFSHLIAVSGAHVAFFTAPFSALLGLTMIRADRRKLLLIIPALFLWFAAGGSCTVTRAVIMFICGALAAAGRKAPNVKNTLGIAGIVTLAGNPFSVFSTGFLLSYGAVLSIALILPALGRIRFFRSRFTAPFMPGIAVNSGLLPLMMNRFGAFSPCGMLLSVPASYIAALITVGGYGVYAMDKLFSWLDLKGAAGAMVTLSYGLQKAADGIAGGKSWFFRTECGAPGIVFFIIYYAILVWLVTGRKRKILPAAAAFCAVLALLGNGMKRVEVLFFDVGQGSAALVRTVDGVTGLVDTGTGDRDLAALMKREGVFKLDFIVISHGHSDHYGGLAEVLKEYSPETVFVPDNAFDKYCNELGLCFGVNTVAVEGSLSLTLGKYTAMELSESRIDREDLNDGSLVVSLRGKWGSIVIPGDAGDAELEELFERGELGKTEVFCLAHHGSKTSGNEKILWEISPKYVIISAGYGNSYGHPSKLVLETLKNQGIGDSRIYRTDRDGAIRVTAGVDPFGGEFTFLWRRRQSLF